MKKIWIILIAVIGVLVLAGVGGLVVADRTFALLQSPKLSHVPYMMPETRVQIALVPEIGAEGLFSLIEHALPEEQRPSEWVLRRVFPHHTVVFMAPDIRAGVVHLTTFVNDQRLGPFIRDAVNKADLSEALPTVRWAHEGMVLEQRGVLTLRGEIPIDPQTMELAGTTWPETRVDATLALEGGHMLEALLDNRDGGAFTVLSTLEWLMGPDGTNNPDFFVGLFANIAWLRLTANFAGPNELVLSILVECQPDVEEDVPASLQFVLDMSLSQLQGTISEMGAAFSGTSRVEDKTVIGEYTLFGLDKLIAAEEEI